jgi:cell wall assembly regulator SMI1
MHYRRWVERAVRFTRSLRKGFPGAMDVRSADASPPASVVSIRRAEKAIGREIPRPLRRFYEGGSAACDCRYYWEFVPPYTQLAERYLQKEQDLYGGASFEPLRGLPALVTSAEQWAAMLDDGSEMAVENRAALWRGAMPFIHILNGDMIALDTAGGKADPPVLYLCHDDNQSCAIAETFDAFLDAWERVKYIGPEGWMLWPFTRGRRRLFDPTVAQVRGMERLFTPGL